MGAKNKNHKRTSHPAESHVEEASLAYDGTFRRIRSGQGEPILSAYHLLSMTPCPEEAVFIRTVYDRFTDSFLVKPKSPPPA